MSPAKAGPLSPASATFTTSLPLHVVVQLQAGQREVIFPIVVSRTAGTVSPGAVIPTGVGTTWSQRRQRMCRVGISGYPHR